MVATELAEIPHTTIIKSWRKAWSGIENNVHNITIGNICFYDDQQSLLSHLQKITTECQEIDVKGWVTGDQELENGTLADQEITNVVCQLKQIPTEIRSKKKMKKMTVR